MQVLVSFLLFIVLSMPGFGQQGDAAFVKKLQDHYKTVKSITANFTQRKQSMLFDEPLLSKGLFYYQSPDKIRWEQQEPTATYLVINKDEIIQFDGESIKKSTGLTMQMSIFRQFILGTVDGSILKDEAFKKSFSSKNGKMFITLVPVDKRMAKRLHKVELMFDEKTMVLDHLKMFENSADFTEINFTEQQLNTTVPSSIFQ